MKFKHWSAVAFTVVSGAASSGVPSARADFGAEVDAAGLCKCRCVIAFGQSIEGTRSARLSYGDGFLDDQCTQRVPDKYVAADSDGKCPTYNAVTVDGCATAYAFGENLYRQLSSPDIRTLCLDAVPADARDPGGNTWNDRVKIQRYAVCERTNDVPGVKELADALGGVLDSIGAETLSDVPGGGTDPASGGTVTPSPSDEPAARELRPVYETKY